MYQYNATVIKVVDALHLNIDLGFNVNYNNQIIRLARINTPELSTDKGVTVKDLVTNLLLNKQVIINTIKDKRDKYGRYLVEVYLDNLNINDYLLDNDYAVKY